MRLVRGMDLEGKLQLNDRKLCLLNPPKGFAFDGPTADKPTPGGAVLLFVATLADVKKNKAPVVAAAKRDDHAWIAYPKAGQLGTDLNRDILWQFLLKDGIQGVRQIAIDDVWSAMRFRPKK
jgi:hypothetical protein